MSFTTSSKPADLNSPTPSTKSPKAPGLEEEADQMAETIVRNLRKVAQDAAAAKAAILAKQQTSSTPEKTEASPHVTKSDG